MKSSLRSLYAAGYSCEKVSGLIYAKSVPHVHLQSCIIYDFSIRPHVFSLELGGTLCVYLGVDHTCLDCLDVLSVTVSLSWGAGGCCQLRVECIDHVGYMV
jgi:hypothetical protein